MQLLDSDCKEADLVAVVVVVVAAVVEDIVAVVFVAAFEVVEVEVSVVVVIVVSVVAVFVAVVLILPTLITKGLEPGRQDHQISNIISSSSVYLFSLTYLLHHDRPRTFTMISK